MSATKAIVLAAGVGSRLRPLTADRPKCLLEVGGRTLLQHQMDALGQCGVTEVVVVVGYAADQIRRHAGASVRYIPNERYASTNSLYSLWLARAELTTGVLILNSDVFAPLRLFDRLQRAAAPDALLVELGHNFDPEDMKVRLEGNRVRDFGKHLPPEQADAHNVGVAKFGREGAGRLAECLDRLIAAGHENDWVPVAFGEFAHRWPLIPIATDGLPWIEIDYAADLARAQTVIGPAILALGDAVAADR